MTQIFWYIVHLIVAVFAFRFGFRMARNLADYRRSTENIEREIPFTLFLEAYGKAPDRWTLLPYYVRYGADDVRFENYADYRKYKKWREKRKQDVEAERKREANEALYREIQSDLMPPPPTTGSAAIKPNPNFTPPPTVYKPTTREALLEEIKKYAERKQWGGNPLEKAIDQTILNQREHGPKSGNFGNCGNCICYRQRTQVDGYCDTHRTVTQATSSCPLYIEAGKEHRKKCGACGKCRQFDKGDNSPFGYCFRNDEIVNEASVKGCFEPKNKAEERPEPLGTVTTN